METIDVINDRVTCLDLIYFLSQKFWLWNCLFIGIQKKRRRSQQIVCLRKTTILESNLYSQQVGVFQKDDYLSSGKDALAHTWASIRCWRGHLCHWMRTVLRWWHNLLLLWQPFLLLSSLDIAQAISRGKSVRCKTLRFSWLHLFFSVLADTNRCSALTSLHHVASHKGLPHNCICVWICPHHHL